MSSAAVQEIVLTLDAAIEEAVAAGALDPLKIVDGLRADHGEAWLRAAVAAKADDFARGRARDILTNRRHRAEKKASDEAKSSPSKKAKTTTLTTAASIWIPDEHGGTEMPYADVTAADLRAKGLYYRERSEAFTARAAWCYDTADAMDAAGVTVLAELDELVPPPAGVLDDLKNGDDAK